MDGQTFLRRKQAMYKKDNNNVYYLLVGVVLGAVLGILVCDETKKKLQRQLKDKAKKWSSCCKSNAASLEADVQQGKNNLQSAVKEYFNED